MKKERLTIYVDQEEAVKLVTEHQKKKNLNLEILSVEEIYNPYYIFNNIIRIKRAFGLKPKVIEHIYWVDAVSGAMVRSAELPEIEEFNGTRYLKEIFSKEECVTFSRENALKHAARFYKSFWFPEVDVEKKGYVYLLYWCITVNYENSNESKKFLVNSYNGDIFQYNENLKVIEMN